MAAGYPQILRPRGRVKPNGSLRLLPRLAPRGLLYCLPMSGPDYSELISGGANFYVGNPILYATTAFGNGASFSGINNNERIVVESQVQPPLVWSCEALVYVAGTAAGFICGWSQGTAAFDHSLFIDTTGKFAIYIYAGTGVTVAGTTVVAAGNFYHVVATCDGATLAIYVNGTKQNSGAVANSGYRSYTLPCNFACGDIYGGGTNSPVSNIPLTGTILLTNFYQVALTAPEVFRRFAAPWNFLASPADFAATMLVGVAVAPSGGTPTIFPMPF